MKSTAAYILHTRPYRETSLLVDALTLNYGRISLIAYGAKKGKMKISNSLQLFLPLYLSWHNSESDLVKLNEVDIISPAHPLFGEDAICGLYINELLIKMLPTWDSCTRIFYIYKQTLDTMTQGNQKALRKFEKLLLANLGYAMQLTKDYITGEDIHPDNHYIYNPNQGPKQVNKNHIGAIKGITLLAFATDQYHKEMLKDIKHLMRFVISYYLGNKKLVTRKLFI